MEGQNGVSRRIIDELHSWDIHRDQLQGESGVSRSIIEELHPRDILRDLMLS